MVGSFSVIFLGSKMPRLYWIVIIIILILILLRVMGILYIDVTVK